MSTHYSLAQKTRDLHAQALVWADFLVKWTRQRGNKRKIPVLCYSGMSGIASATALSLILTIKYPRFKFCMVYVRKENENSHGEKIEHNLFGGEGSVFTLESLVAGEAKEKMFPVFVDDFVSGGSTRQYTMAKVSEFFCVRRDISIGQLKQHVDDDFFSRIPTLQLNYEPCTESDSFRSSTNDLWNRYA
jgi:hypothetical protein